MQGDREHVKLNKAFSLVTIICWAGDRERRSKTDPIDARKMARHHAAGLLR